MWDAETGSAVSKHTDQVSCVAYSPNGRHITFGSFDSSIVILDAENGLTLSKLLKEHTAGVVSIAYSPDGRYVISGSFDQTIRMWDAETGSAVGAPFEGHIDTVESVAYSPDGGHIISGSSDGTIRVWDVRAPSAVGDPHEGHSHQLQPTAYSPDCWPAPSAPTTQAIQASSSVPIQSSPADNQIPPDFRARPDQDGWVRDPEGGLLYWVPDYCLIALRSSAHFVIPVIPNPNIRSVSLDFEDFGYGTSWTEIFVGADDSSTHQLSGVVATPPY